MDEQTKSKEELTTIAGGVEMEVKFQNNGDSEVVKVRQVPISKIERYASVMLNSAESIELFCDKPKGWADTLTIESALAISKKGGELNLPFFELWWADRMEVMKVQRRVTDTIKGELESATSATPSPLVNSPPQLPTTTT